MDEDLAYIQEIKKIIGTNLSDEISFFSQKTLRELKNYIDDYLIQLSKWSSNAYEVIDKFQQQLPEVEAKYHRYLAIKSLLKEDNEIEKLLKQGYFLIDQIRERVTGEHIQYQIGLEYYGKLYEGKLDLEQIFSLAKVETDWKGGINSLVKLRLSKGGKSSLQSLLQQVSDFKQEAKGENKSLYSSVRAYASSNKIKNKGNVYEAYRQLKEKYKADSIPPAKWDPMEFDVLYSQTLKNTASFVKGGDILTDQVKFFGTNAPSLATLGTIRNTLIDFNKIISSTSKQQLKQELEYFFTKKDEIIFKASVDINKQTKNIVDKISKNLTNQKKFDII